MTESVLRALGLTMRRATSTLVVDADSLSPPACSTKSSSVSLAAYLYMPGYITSPCMVTVCCCIISPFVGTNSTSFFCRGMSATLPLIMPSMSTGITSKVRSGRMRCITARAVKASSVMPSACSISVRTLLMEPPTWYMPGRNTAPFTSAIFEKRGKMESTLTESSSAKWKVLRSNSSTLNTEYSRPVFLTSLTVLV